MRVLHVINAFTGGGAEKLLHDTVITQKKKGVDVEVCLLSQKNNHYLDAVKSKGIQVHISRYESLYSPGHIKELKKIINQGNYDIVHVHLFPSLYWGAFAKLLTNKHINFVYTEHSTHNRRRDKPYLKLIENFIYRQYARIFCISDGTEENLHEWISNTMKKTKVVPNGINLQNYTHADPYKKKDLFPGAEENDKLIVMIARFTQQKDHETLIRSLKYLDDIYKVLLVGDGERLEYIKKLTISEGVSDRVQFLGFRKDIPQILKTSDIFVLSSHWEGFGLVAAEAMASGLPVLVSDVEGLRDVVDCPDLTFPQGDSERLAEKIKNTLENTDISNEFIAYGLYRVRNFSIESMVESLINEYRRIINN